MGRYSFGTANGVYTGPQLYTLNYKVQQYTINGQRINFILSAVV